MKPRNDDFLERRKHLEKLTDQELKTYFWELTEKLTDPLLKLAYEYTTPAIERSVLMRMGFSSLESKWITDKLLEYHLLEHGAGHVVYRYAKANHLTIREAGLALLHTDEIEKIRGEFK